jgi:hypothetical protein
MNDPKITNNRKPLPRYKWDGNSVPVRKLTDVQLVKAHLTTEVRKGRIAEQILKLQKEYHREVLVLAQVSKQIEERDLGTFEPVEVCDSPSIIST